MADTMERTELADGGATKEEKSTEVTNAKKEDSTRSSMAQSNETEKNRETESRANRSHHSNKRKYDDDDRRSHHKDHHRKHHDDGRRSHHKDHHGKRSDGKWERGGGGRGRGNKRDYSERYPSGHGEKRGFYDSYLPEGNEVNFGKTDHYSPDKDNGSRQKRQKLNRSSYEDLPESEDHDEIRRQVEFYFSDSNLPVDRYLLGLTGGHENKSVDLKVIHDFKRMQHFQPFSAVVDAIKESEVLAVDDKNMVSRKTPLHEKFTDDPDKNRELMRDDETPRSIYAKGFGDETKTTQTDIESYFEPYGPFNAIRLRRAQENGWFKGSVFVEFKDVETQMRFLQLGDTLEFKGNSLKIMSKADYEESQKQRAEKEKAREEARVADEKAGGADEVKEADDAAKNEEVDGGAKAGKQEAEQAKSTEEEVKEEQGKGEQDSEVDGGAAKGESET